MIEIKVVLSPGGDVWHQEMVGQLFIVNDGTGTIDIGNYDYIMDHARGRIENYPRYDGIWKLIQAILNKEL